MATGRHGNLNHGLRLATIQIGFLFCIDARANHTSDFDKSPVLDATYVHYDASH